MEKAITEASQKKSVRIGDAKRAVSENEKMDRKGGGPMKWSDFYGRTAEKFFYHPTDRNSTYRTLTILTPQPPQNDNRTGEGVPSRQGLPVHQRPPQFDYIYRANQEANERAETEAGKLQGKIEALVKRRSELEQEQNGLWVEIAFHSVAHYDLDKQPLLRFEPVVTTGDAQRNAIVLRSAAVFTRTALSVIDEAAKDKASAFARVRPTVATARQTLTDSWARLEIDASERATNEGKFAALAKRLEEVASNLSDSYEVAMDGDRQQDLIRKETFRGLLQESVVDYAEIVLALHEMAVVLREQSKITFDLNRPLPAVALTPKPPEGKLPAEKNSGIADTKRPTEAETLQLKLAGTKWINTNGATFDWKTDGRLHWNGRDKPWKALDGRRVEVEFGKDHKDIFVFNGSLTEFKKLVKGGSDSHMGRRK